MTVTVVQNSGILCLESLMQALESYPKIDRHEKAVWDDDRNLEWNRRTTEAETHQRIAVQREKQKVR